MGHRFAEIAFTDTVKTLQAQMGSRLNYAAMEAGDAYNHVLGPTEKAFIADRDSFYMASISETGWPYVQHRGGPKGFIKVLDDRTIGFADYSGNRQYVSVGNLTHEDRVSLFFMDYPNRRRLKMLGRASVSDDPKICRQLADESYEATVERAMVIRIEGFDWNCPQHITPRYTITESPVLSPGHLSRETIGQGPLRLTVTAIRQETPRIRSFELRSPDGKPLPAVTPGAHIQLPILEQDGSLLSRHYSITSPTDQRDYYEVAVLAEVNGRGSPRLHATYLVGQTLLCEPPDNHFPLQDDKHVILVAGGIGITPIQAMAETLRRCGRSFEIHYAGRSRREMAFLDRLTRAFPNELSIYAGADNERLDVHCLLSKASPKTGIYVCGPERLTEAVIEHARSLPIDESRVRFERFVAPVPDDAEPIRVRLAASRVDLEVSAGESILDALLNAGIAAPHSCKTGVCRTCAVSVLEGVPLHRDEALATDERETLMCPCVSRAKTTHLTLDL